MSIIDVTSAQKLVTKKSYFDWSETRVREVFTVIAGTGTKQGSYKQYNEYGEVEISANYNNNQLHGIFTIYSGTSPNHVTCISNYVNGKKNGIEKEYAVLHDYCLEAVRVYKNDVIIELTNYYTNQKSRGKKKDYSKLEGEMVQTSGWYENGNMQFEQTIKPDPNTYNEFLTPFRYTKYNEEGVIVEKLENDVLSIYTDDGKMLKQKENQSAGISEFYENGSLVKTIRIFSENNEELKEVTLYNDNQVSSKQVLNKDGKDVEVLRKQKQLEIRHDSLCKVYNSLYKELEEIYPLETYRKQGEYRKPRFYNQGACKSNHRASYESDEKASLLSAICKQYKDCFNKIADERGSFRAFNPESGTSIDQTDIDKINVYIERVKRENIIQDYETLFAMENTVNRIINDLYYIECAYTDHRGDKDIVPNKHKIAYNTYISVTKYLLAELENEDLNNKWRLIQLYETVCSKMRKWEKEKISSIEKLLKKAQTTEDQLLVFLKNDIDQK